MFPTATKRSLCSRTAWTSSPTADLRVDAEEAVKLRKQLALMEAAFRALAADRRDEAIRLMAALANSPKAADEANERRARRERERLFEQAQLSGADSSRRAREPA